MQTTAKPSEIAPDVITEALRAAGIDAPLTATESTDAYEYLAAGDIEVTWYRENSRAWGERLVFELDTPTRAVADAGENAEAFLQALARELAA